MKKTEKYDSLYKDYSHYISNDSYKIMSETINKETAFNGESFDSVHNHSQKKATFHEVVKALAMAQEDARYALGCGCPKCVEKYKNDPDITIF